MPVQEHWFDNLEPERYLSRDQLVTALSLAGFEIGYSTLSNMKARGEGPPWERIGGAVIYRWGDALEWARARSQLPEITSEDIREAVKEDAA